MILVLNWQNIIEVFCKYNTLSWRRASNNLGLVHEVFPWLFWHTFEVEHREVFSRCQSNVTHPYHRVGSYAQAFPSTLNRNKTSVRWWGYRRRRRSEKDLGADFCKSFRQVKMGSNQQCGISAWSWIPSKTSHPLRDPPTRDRHLFPGCRK